jgi:hypothetical protein
MSEGSLSFDAEVAGHQVIFRAGQVEAVVVPWRNIARLRRWSSARPSCTGSLTRAGIRPGQGMTSLTATCTTRWKR